MPLNSSREDAMLDLKFLLDENIPKSVKNFLEHRG